MQSALESRITGFYLRPEFQNDHGEEKVKSLEVEYLEDGRSLATEFFENVNEEFLNKVQLHLLQTVLSNVYLKKYINSKKIVKNRRVLGVVNMFKIEVLKENEDGSKDIQIMFLKSGYFFMESMCIQNVSKEKLEEIRDILVNNVSYNLECDRQCSAVTAIDLMAIIDQKM